MNSGTYGVRPEKIDKSKKIVGVSQSQECMWKARQNSIQSWLRCMKSPAINFNTSCAGAFISI